MFFLILDSDDSEASEEDCFPYNVMDKKKIKHRTQPQNHAGQSNISINLNIAHGLLHMFTPVRVSLF